LLFAGRFKQTATHIGSASEGMISLLTLRSLLASPEDLCLRQLYQKRDLAAWIDHLLIIQSFEFRNEVYLRTVVRRTRPMIVNQHENPNMMSKSNELTFTQRGKLYHPYDMLKIFDNPVRSYGL
jgi:hypothetical protein